MEGTSTVKTEASAQPLKLLTYKELWSLAKSAGFETALKVEEQQQLFQDLDKLEEHQINQILAPCKQRLDELEDLAKKNSEAIEKNNQIMVERMMTVEGKVRFLVSRMTNYDAKFEGVENEFVRLQEMLHQFEKLFTTKTDQRDPGPSTASSSYIEEIDISPTEDMVIGDLSDSDTALAQVPSLEYNKRAPSVDSLLPVRDKVKILSNTKHLPSSENLLENKRASLGSLLQPVDVRDKEPAHYSSPHIADGGVPEVRPEKPGGATGSDGRKKSDESWAITKAGKGGASGGWSDDRKKAGVSAAVQTEIGYGSYESDDREKAGASTSAEAERRYGSYESDDQKKNAKACSSHVISSWQPEDSGTKSGISQDQQEFSPMYKQRSIPTYFPDLGFTARPEWCFTTSGLGRDEKMIVFDFAGFVRCRVVPEYTKDVTHVIIVSHDSPDPLLGKRTIKYFFGISAKCWLVSLHWVTQSILQMKLLPECDFEIAGDMTYGTKYHYSPQRSRLAETALFGHYELLFSGDFTFCRQRDLVYMASRLGATLVKDPSCFSLRKDRNMLVVVDEERVSNAEEFIDMQKDRKILVVTKDWLLNCIAEYTLKDPFPFRAQLEKSCLPEELQLQLQN